MKYRGRKGRRGSMYFTHFCLSFCFFTHLSRPFWSNFSRVTRFCDPIFIPWKAPIVSGAKGLTEIQGQLFSCTGELKTESALYLLDFFVRLHRVFVAAVFHVQFEWCGWKIFKHEKLSLKWEKKCVNGRGGERTGFNSHFKLGLRSRVLISGHLTNWESQPF